jgi:CTP synthase (UTP-ammonia lyase)
MLILGEYQQNVKRALSEIDKDFERRSGIVICGSHHPTDTERLVKTIKLARKKKIPFLGICYGHQLAAIQYARDVLGIKDATSEEWGKGTFVIKKRPRMKVGLHDGQSWWSNYYVAIDWKKPSWFITTPFHPEYQSSKWNPHPDLIKFLKICRNT